MGKSFFFKLLIFFNNSRNLKIFTFQGTVHSTPPAEVQQCASYPGAHGGVLRAAQHRGGVLRAQADTWGVRGGCTRACAPPSLKWWFKDAPETHKRDALPTRNPAGRFQSFIVFLGLYWRVRSKVSK